MRGRAAVGDGSRPFMQKSVNSVNMNTDLIIIGAGPGGYECAVKAATSGLSVVIIEKKHPGGTCLNEGCIPTKCFCQNANAAHLLERADHYGFEVTKPPINMGMVVRRKNEVVSRLSAGIMSLLSVPGITYVEGEARFIEAHTIVVNGDEYSAPAVIIATGSRPKKLPVLGYDLTGVLTSSEMLDLTTLPTRLCVIGGGVIGMEFASIFSAFGSKVAVVEYAKEVLPNFDRDLAKRLRTSLKKRGISFHTAAAVTAIKSEGDTSLSVEYEEKGKLSCVEADVVLMAVGRTPNFDVLNLAAVGIEATPRGIVVDSDMQTNVDGVYAVGDVNGLCPLAHAATFQSYRALNHILGRKDNLRLDLVPAAVFTSPEAAMVGLTEENAVSAGISYSAHKSFYRANGKALAMDAEDGMVKLLTDADDNVIGAHILGEHAADLIHEIALLMKMGGKRSQLAELIHAHPSLSELVLAAAEN